MKVPSTDEPKYIRSTSCHLAHKARASKTSIEWIVVNRIILGASAHGNGDGPIAAVLIKTLDAFSSPDAPFRTSTLALVDCVRGSAAVATKY
jgi:hypothetical protein